MTDLTATHADDSDNDNMLARISNLQQRIDISMPETTDDLWAECVRLENDNALLAARRGLIYLALKSKLPHGEFLDGLHEREISPRSAQTSMSIARLLLSSKKLNAVTSPHLKKSKLIELAKLPIDDIDELFEQGDLDLDEIDAMPVRDLRSHVRDLRAKITNADLGRENAELKLAQALNDSDAGQRDNTPAEAVRIRVESAALSAQSIDCIDSMAELIADIRNHYDVLDSSGNYESAAGSVLVHLNAVQAKIAMTIAQFAAEFDEIAISDDAVPMLSEAESRQYLTRREIATMEHRTAAIAREEARAARAPKKRGPKPGSKKSGN